MNLRPFNAALRRSRLAVEQHLPELELAYERLIRQAAREASTALVATTELVPMTAAVGDTPRWQIPPEGLLFAIATVADRAARKLGRLHRRIVRDITGPPLAHVGIVWDITHPLSQTLLDLSAQRTGERLGQTIQPVLREIVAGAYADGLPVRDAAALIRAKFEEASPAQAAMLARTDLNSLGNGGSVMAATLVGVTYKQWLTAEDDRVRETHAEADGQTVPIDAPFSVGGELLDYPGDPGGSDEEVCNCRCTVIYVDQGEAETASAKPRGRVPSRGFMAAPVFNAKGLGEAMARASKNFKTYRIPARGFAAAPVAPPIAWVSDIAFEGAATGDGRYMLPDAITWRDLPIPLMALTETGPGGHEGAFTAGKIISIERDQTYNMDGEPLPDGVTAIRARGTFDTNEASLEVGRLVGEQIIRGVSIDPGEIEAVLRDPDTGEILEPADLTGEQIQQAMFGELETAFRHFEIGAATVCPIPAFADARIALMASGLGRRSLWAPLRVDADGLTASAAPVAPPAEWFHREEADQPTPLTVTDEGQVFGHVAAWDSCHTGRAGICVTPPRSPSGYSYFNLGEVRCADGKRVACGQVFFHGEHAPLTLTPSRVRDHYAHSGLVGADVRATDGRFGIWVSGALRSSLTPTEAREFMAAKPSGDWRQMRPGGPLELTAVLAVNDPGFPVPRGIVASADDCDGESVALLAAFDLPIADTGRIPTRGFARV